MTNTLPTDYQNFIAVSRYARWLDDENRRETWTDTVSRYVDYICSKVTIDSATKEYLWEAIHSLQVMPSMRALMTAGVALERDNTAGYNCAYLPVDDPKSFDETMYVLLCGTGVGFSVERQYTEKLPEVPDKLYKSDTCVKVKDSKEGWAKAFRVLISLLYAGEIPTYDVSAIRPAGARLKTFGGRASGPGPLVELFEFTINMFENAKSRRLTSYECHSIMCKIGEIVVVGGVRRSAMISLSDLDDDRMRRAKKGEFWKTAPHMRLANNSVAYTEKPDSATFLQEWQALIESQTGERGIFNRQAAQKQAEKNGRRTSDIEFGCNPCSEIILRPYQFCNLTEVVIRDKDTTDDLARKVRLATILGTAQATLTKFPYLRKVWQNNTEEERLLGVSLTGIMDNGVTSKAHDLPSILNDLKQIAIDTNKVYAEKFGIPQSTAITCVKPSGTVSQLCDTASGIHPRYSNYYIRTVRGDTNDPLTQFMKDQGVPSEPCIYKPSDTVVFSFPFQSPKTSTTVDTMTAIDQLELWLTYQRHWCEHKPSCSVYVRDHEWIEVGAFVYKHFDEMSGVSFFPVDDVIYHQPPYSECTKEEYEEAIKKAPSRIDWSLLKDFEKEDTTSSSQTFACSGDSCEVVDIGA